MIVCFSLIADTNHVPPAENNRSSKRNCHACHPETRIKTTADGNGTRDPMLTGPHFNRPEGIIGSQYLGPLSRYVRMPARIVNSASAAKRQQTVRVSKRRAFFPFAGRLPTLWSDLTGEKR